MENIDTDLKSIIRTTKQKYLCSNIIDKNYNPEAFTSYIESKKENGGSIDNWTLEELIQHVDNFTRLPHIFFPDQHEYDINSCFRKIKVNIEENGDFTMTIANNPNILKRKTSDLQFTIEHFSKEHPNFRLPPNWTLPIQKSRYLLEYLLSLNQCFSSPILKNFFTLSETDFNFFIKVFLIGI